MSEVITKERAHDALEVVCSAAHEYGKKLSDDGMKICGSDMKLREYIKQLEDATQLSDMESMLLNWAREKRNRITLEYFFGFRDSKENEK